MKYILLICMLTLCGCQRGLPPLSDKQEQELQDGFTESVRYQLKEK